MNSAKLTRVLPRDVPDYHERQASHLRALAGATTTPGIRHRLLEEAERHEALAQEAGAEPREP